MRNTGLLVLLLSTWLGPARSTLAQGDDYRDTIEAAVAAYGEERFEEAYGLFVKAHSLQPSARTLRGLGLAAFETRRYVDAIHYLSAALSDARMPLTPAQRKEAQSIVDTAATSVVHLELDVQPAGATVAVDGRALERSNRGVVLLDPGMHQLVGSAEGYQVAIRSVQWAPSTHARLELRLLPEPAGADGKAVGRRDRRREAGDSAPASRHEESSAKRSIRAFKWVSLGGAIASLALAGAAVAVRQDRARSLRNSCVDYVSSDEQDRSCMSWYQSGKTWRAGAIATAAIGTGFAAATVALFVLDRAKEEPQSKTLRARYVGVAPLSLSYGSRF